MESIFEIDGKRFRLKTWSAADVEQIETSMGDVPLLDLGQRPTLRLIYTTFYVCVRGQEGIKALSDARAFVTLERARRIEEALAPFFKEALNALYALSLEVVGTNGQEVSGEEGAEVVAASPLP